MSNNVGLFPSSNLSLDIFTKEYLKSISISNVLGVWNIYGEDRLIERFCAEASLIPARTLSAPYFYKDPWSAALRGKRVLVISPFVESISDQFQRKRERIWEDPEVLPPFELHLLNAVQSIAGQPTEFDTWTAALGSMKDQMESIDFDICLVGAGGYGVPLAAHAKRLGRKGVVLGGATQILFGVRGRRWDEREDFQAFFNDAWTRCKPSEIPTNSALVEDGCYW